MHLRTGIWLLVCGLCCSLGWAQDMTTPKGYYPLQHPLPTGRAGNWAGLLGKHDPDVFQLVRVHVPSQAQLTWYTAGGAVGGTEANLTGLLVGPVYRLKISDMPEFPGADFYPTVEVIDRLHPPADRARDFPVPITLTRDEFAYALTGRMVTKVVYLEQPDRARIVNDLKGTGLPALELTPDQNPLESADQLGRPIAIVRLGGRRFDPARPEPDFFGAGAPVIVEPLPVATETADITVPPKSRKPLAKVKTPPRPTEPKQYD